VCWWENLRESDHLEEPDIDRRIILKWIFRKWNVGTFTGLIWHRIGQVTGTCERGNSPLRYLNVGNFLTNLESVIYVLIL